MNRHARMISRFPHRINLARAIRYANTVPLGFLNTVSLGVSEARSVFKIRHSKFRGTVSFLGRPFPSDGILLQRPASASSSEPVRIQRLTAIYVAWHGQCIAPVRLHFF